MSTQSLDAIALAPPGRGAHWQIPLAVGAALLAAATLFDPSAVRPAVALAGVVGSLLLLAHALQRSVAAARPTSEAPRLATELRDSLHRLADSEERYRTVIEHAGDPILTLDLTGMITSVNRAAELFFGWERHELVGIEARRMFAAESVRAIDEWAHAELLTPREPTPLALDAVHREGRLLHVEAKAAVLRKSGMPVGTELVCRDVTARKELDRVRAEFLAMMGHDIRNPLGAIFGYTEMLLENGRLLPPEHRELLLRIEANTRSVLTLIGNFLDSSQIDARQLAIKRRDVDLNTLVRRIVEQYAAQAHLVDVPVVLALAPELPEIAADPLQVERIVSNLLTNAIKFTPGGGRVTVATERLPSCVAVAITDTGIGIAPHEFSRIFQRYARTGDLNREGTGLGLYIVETLIEAHGGFVTVDSTLGAGTTFTVYLPITDWRVGDRARPQESGRAATVH